VVLLTKNQHRWGFACGRVSVLEGRLMPLDFFVSLVALERPEDLLHRLQDTPLRESLIPGAATWEDWSTIVDTYVYRHVIEVRRNSPDPALTDLFLLAQDYLNLKRAVLNAGSYPFLSGVFSEERLAEVAGGNSALLPQDLRRALASLSTSSAGEGGAFLTDVVLDGAYLRHVMDLAAKLDVPHITACVDLMVLARAVVVAWRAIRAGQSVRFYQQHFLPLGKHTGVMTGLLASADPQAWGAMLPVALADPLVQAQQEYDEEQVIRFEQLAANAVTRMARHAKLQTMGPERVFGFLWGLLVEAYNFKLVIRGRLNRIDAEMLKRRLRECYV